MKRKLFILALLTAAVLLTFSGCIVKKTELLGQSGSASESFSSQDSRESGPESSSSGPESEPSSSPEDPSSDEVYAELLRYYCGLIDSGAGFDEAGPGETGVLEAVNGRTDGLDRVGYAVLDLTGDGVPELLIGEIPEEDSGAQGNAVYAAYTVADGQAVLAFEGFARSSYRYMGGSSFMYEGSAGAMYWAFGDYSLEPDGRGLVCHDFYFTGEREDDPGAFAYYRNTGGEWDEDGSERLDLSDEAFLELYDELYSQVRLLPLTPLSAFCPSGGTGFAEAGPVRAQWAAESSQFLPDCDEYVADDSEPQSEILFTAESDTADFTLLTLTLDEAALEAGEFAFSAEELYVYGTLTPECPLLVRLTFTGTIPRYGISFTDENGEVRRFALDVSGMDGSLLLTEF